LAAATSAASSAATPVRLDDRSTLDDRPVYLTGSQALVRLVIEQARQDEASERHLEPPILNALGRHGKIELGPWMRPVFRVLARGKVLRGRAIDPLGETRSAGGSGG
jgi:hypothetical protein